MPLLKRNNISSIFVHDQEQARTFYTEVLGLEVADDLDFGPMRWLTVRVPDDPKVILLERPGPPGMDEATAAQVRELVAKGADGGWLAFATDDLRGMYDRLKDPGVDFTREIVEQPYGSDFAVRDRFGNHIRIGDVNGD